MGCGSGEFCRLAADRGAVVHGVDGMPDRIAIARRSVPPGDFRVGLMEHLPWEDDSFDVVAGFNSFQYALDIHAALAEACRVARRGGRLAVCKYGRPADNQFFAFMGAVDPAVDVGRLPERDSVARAIEDLRLRVVATGQVPSDMALVGEDALVEALATTGAERSRVLAAAAPYRQPDGSYRFENRLKYWLIAT